MKDTMYHLLAETVHEHRSWIAVHRSDEERTMMVRTGRKLHPMRCRVLTLVARWQNGMYKRGHVWDIPEYELDKAVRSLKRNPQFKARWAGGKITVEDAEAIIHKASYGFLRLELDADI